jgi:hypothetical protein
MLSNGTKWSEAVMNVVDYSQQMGYIYYRRILMPALLAGCCAIEPDNR